jgi:hypothetical protein
LSTEIFDPSAEALETRGARVMVEMDLFRGFGFIASDSWFFGTFTPSQ